MAISDIELSVHVALSDAPFLFTSLSRAEVRRSARNVYKYSGIRRVAGPVRVHLGQNICILFLCIMLMYDVWLLKFC